MKFKIRYADRIVGLLTIIALVSLIFVIFMLGRTQNWFSKKYSFKTYARSASGISKNMPVTCRGIAVGNVKSFNLTADNRVEVIFTIQEEHIDRAKEGSLVEVVVSSIGLGGSFNFYPGNGEKLDEWSIVPMRDSPEAREYLAQGLAYIPFQDEPIADLLEKLNNVIDGLNAKTNETATTALGQSIVNLEQLTANLAADLGNPNGIRRILNGDTNAINAVEDSLVSLSGTLDSIDQAMRFIPREMPQIINLLSEARTAIQSANDVLISLKNNPLLRKGIPEQAVIDSSGTNPRNIRF